MIRGPSAPVGELNVGIVVIGSVSPQQRSEQFRNAHREQVVDRGSQMSGGMAETVGSAIGLDSMAQRMAALIAGQYVITYGPGGGSGTGSRRSVTVAGKGLRVLAPAWNPR